MVEMLNATVIIRVIPALVRMVLNSFVMARLENHYPREQEYKNGDTDIEDK